MRKILLFLLPSLLSAQVPNSVTFTFTVPPSLTDMRTSAGVYDSTGQMVRYLWGGKVYTAGTYKAQWDGKYQNGSAGSTGATYTIKLLENNVNYTFDGRFGTTQTGGNSAVNSYGRYTWQQGTEQRRFVFIGNTGWMSSGYNEGSMALSYFTDINYPQPVSGNYNNVMPFGDIATDGVNLYLTQPGSYYPTANPLAPFLTVLSGASGMPVFFTNGAFNTSYPSTVLSVIDNKSTTTASITSGTTALSVGDGSQFWNGRSIAIFGAASGGGTLNTYVVSGGGVSGPTTLQIANPAGTTLPNVSWPTGWMLSIDYYSIAVQRNGPILAIYHSGGRISLFNKTTGASLGSINDSRFTGGQIAFSSEGLWVTGGAALYLVTDVGNTNVISQPIGGLLNVLSVAVNGSTNSVFVLDGSTRQQMMEFAANTHSLLRTYGKLGGYCDCDPTITNDRLLLDQTCTKNTGASYGSFIRVQDSGDAWISDGNAYRILHISPSNQYVGRHLFRRPTYYMGVAHNNPNRILVGLIEYDIDYTKPLQLGDPDPAVGGNGSWSLAKNWAVCSMGAGGSQSAIDYSSGYNPWQIEQLSNGVLYGIYNSYSQIVQFPASGPMKPVTGLDITTIRPNSPTGAALSRDGSLSYVTSIGATSTFYKAPSTGFDSNQNPTVGPYAVVDTGTATTLNSYIYPRRSSSIFSSEPTAGGIWALYWNSAPYNITSQAHFAGLHGGVYSALSSPEYYINFPDNAGTFPQGSSFGGANGKGLSIEGHNVFLGYDGQGASWGNQIYHFWEDGLLVGQFGQSEAGSCGYTMGGAPYSLTSYCGWYYGDVSSNWGTWGSTTYNGDIYVYHPDGEQGWGAFVRWHISNLASIHEFSGAVALAPGATVTLAQISTTSPSSPSSSPSKERREERRERRRKLRLFK